MTGKGARMKTRFIERMMVGLAFAFAADVVQAAVSADADAGQVGFAAAVPVWPEGRTMEENAFVGFRGTFTAKTGERPVLRVAGSSLYRAWVNGRFAGCGPVRAGHGYARIDEWPLEKLVRNGTNVVAIEVRAYNFYSGGIINLAVQPGFLQAEVLRDDHALCATGRDFTFFDLPNVKNVSRWSAERAYIEAYRLKQDWNAWRTMQDLKGGTPVLVKGPKLLPRILSYPDLKVVPGHAAFTTTFDWDASSPKKNPKLAFDSRDAIGRVKAVKSIPVPAATEQAYHPVGKGRGVIAAFGKNNAVNAGFPGFIVRCREPGVMWCVIDEGLIGGVVDPVKRLRHPMAFVLDLQAPGEYRIEAFEATSLAYAHVFMESGAAEVGGFFLREYKNPLAYRATFECSDAALNRIFAAAQETCAQNTMDSEMDCPSRERNCCSMDANMVLQGYNLLAGDRDVERLFFENRHFSTNFPGTRAGWLPSHYPANVTFAVYGNIPNLAMWFILHLERHTRETGDRTLADMLRGRVLTAVAELEKYRNADGLLESLPGWTFVGWGNEGQGTNFKGVNHPTNMLWAETLAALARLYGQPERLAEAERVRSAVRRLSWNGTWFRDGDQNSKTSEGCQCYAFFCNLASPSTDPDLWRRFVEELGPGRAKGARPEVIPAETWMGGMMRIDCLLRAGMDRQARADMKRYFQHMADLSGTLWEGLDRLAANTMSQGFNAVVADYLAQGALGVRRIDHRAKRVELRAPSDGELAYARGSFPTADGPIVYGWTRENGAFKEEVRLPPGWVRGE